MVRKKEEKNYILTLNTNLPHHIAQILKWQFVLALFALIAVQIHKENRECIEESNKLLGSHTMDRNVRDAVSLLLLRLSLKANKLF